MLGVFDDNKGLQIDQALNIKIIIMDHAGITRLTRPLDENCHTGSFTGWRFSIEKRKTR